MAEQLFFTQQATCLPGYAPGTISPVCNSLFQNQHFPSALFSTVKSNVPSPKFGTEPFRDNFFGIKINTTLSMYHIIYTAIIYNRYEKYTLQHPRQRF